MNNKEKYQMFCKTTYIPIYSKSWWLDALCGPENWDVWLYEKGGTIMAAMPYYMENRGTYRYITKALLSQNNGLIFKYPDGVKEAKKYAFEEKVIDEACNFIKSLELDVYEQQYHYSFSNWLPFFWNRYTAITRYTYVFEDLTNMEGIWDGVASGCRSTIRKGQKNSELKFGLDYKVFYQEHEKIFLKQGLVCPFSFEQWEKLYEACSKNNAGRILYRTTENNEITSLMFLVWDEQSSYQLLAGSIPEYQNMDTYAALIWDAIEYTANMNLKYDFEGSVIKRISESFREFCGTPKPYFRIRKVFNPEIIRKEAEEQITHL